MVEHNQSEPPQSGGQNRAVGIRAVIGITLVAFLLGIALAGWFAWRAQKGSDFDPLTVATDDAAIVAEEIQPSPTPSATVAKSSRETVKAVEKVALQQGGFDQRLAALEQRLVRIDLQANAAAGNAARAEGLLIAFAARRALERGTPLGYLGDQVRLRFGDARPNAVRTIIDASRNPVTLDQLLARLEGLAPRLRKTPADENILTRLQREFDSLFIIRRESSPSPVPQRRLERARLFLESGRIEAAIAEVRNLPGAAEAQEWIADAERYAAVQDALDLIETTAVLEPRKLRDGSGEAVEQLSPVSGD